MADSSINITAGTGTAVDTRTEATNGNHRQVIIIGDPSTNAGVAPVDATAGLKVDLGADNDITGTVTANAGTNLNTSALALEAGGNLAAIKAKTDNIPALGQALAAASVPVVLTAAQETALTPPAAITGFATAAKQDTIIGHVDGVETLLGTIDTDTGNIATAVTDIPNVIGTDGAAGPSKTLSIGGTQATGEIQEVQVDADGQLQVDVLTMPTITETSASAIKTAVELIDDTVFTDDTSTHATGTTKGVGIMAVATPTDASVNANDIGMPAMTTDRKLHVSVQDALPAGTNAIGKLAANSGVDIGDVDVTSIAAGDNNIGNVDIVTVPTDPFGANADAASATGSISAKLRGIATALGVTALDLGSGTGGSRTLRTFQDTAQWVGGTGVDSTAVQRVSLATNVALPAGTNAIGKLAANSGVDIGDVDVTSLPSLVAGTAAIGKLLPPDVDVTAHTNYARKYYTNAGAVTDGIIWSPAAGKRWHVVTMYIQTSAAATITLEDDKAGGDDPVWKGELAANSGVTLSFTEKYPMASGEDAADLIITTSAGNVYVTCVGYEV